MFGRNGWSTGRQETIMSIYGPNGEYARNLYTNAMGIVRNADGSNVYPESDYPNGIPVATVRDMFASHEHITAENTFTMPGEADGVNDDGTIHYGADTHVPTGMRSWVRKSDLTEHARFGAESAENRRQSAWLLDTYAAGLVGGHDGMHITAAGHTSNGARVYLQLATSQILTPAGYDMRPFLTCYMSHDGTLAVGSSFGMSVITCANMLAGITARGVKSKQTSRVTDEQILDRARVGLMMEEQAERAVTVVEQLAATVVTREHWSAILDRIAPVDGPNITGNKITRNTTMRETLHSLYVGDERVAPWEGSALGAFQALNTFDLWNRTVRGGTDRHERITDEFLSGALANREGERLATITSVLAAV